MPYFLHLAVASAIAVSPAVAKLHAQDEDAPRFALPDIALYDQGRFVYEQNCAVCHGERGDGQGEMARDLPIKPRSFRTGLFKYRSTPWGTLPTNEDLSRTILGGRTGTAMGMFNFLSNGDLRAVVEYIKFFSRKWRHEENYAEPLDLPPEPNWLADPKELSRRAEVGGQTFQAICAACHGPAADGHGPSARALKDETGAPDQPADLRQPHLRSGDEPLDIYRVLMTGLNGTPMASFADVLTPEQKWELAAYIITLRGK